MIKKHIFLFNKGSRAAVYGIGTYIRQITLYLKSMEGISLHLVQLNSDVEKVELSCEQDYDELSIPRSFLSIGNKTIRYYQNAWYLIRLYFPIAVDEPVFFLLNYTSHRVLIPEMRAAFPYCRIFFTIHYQEWCFVLNGNVSLLQKIMSVSDRNILDSKELEVYESFLREKQMYNQVDKIICLSHFTEELLWKEYEIPEDKTVLIYNGMKDETADFLLEDRDRLK
ncbi:glycosyltransferase, partial [Parabacteroides johnsonii]|uniref:glycosyltransferase n=1 Tax=Parabacteroides johnsonii TaxID=387661 RepID=UPI00242E2E75